MSFCNIGCPIHHLQRSTVRLPETHITRSVFWPIYLRCCLHCRQVPKCEQMVDYVPICEHTARVKCWLKQAYQRSSAAQFVCPVKQDIKLPRCSHAAKATEVHPGLEREDAATVPHVEVFKDPLCVEHHDILFSWISGTAHARECALRCLVPRTSSCNHGREAGVQRALVIASGVHQSWAFVICPINVPKP